MRRFLIIVSTPLIPASILRSIATPQNQLDRKVTLCYGAYLSAAYCTGRLYMLIVICVIGLHLGGMPAMGMLPMEQNIVCGGAMLGRV